MATYRPIYSKEREWVNTGTPDGEIMVFRPTMEEFSNFSKYMETTIERNNAHLAAGVCKVIPPAGWHPRPSKNPSDYSDLNDFVIHSPVKERIEGGSSTGCYVKNNSVYRKEMLVGDYRRLAFSKQFRPPKPDYDLTELERHFWRNLLHHEPIYGADTPGSIYDSGVSEFNMNGLGTILDLLKEQQLEIKGVNTVFLYFGMWKTMFPWHVEDMDLYSINYLHFGEPKFWYAIPPKAAPKFERLAAQRFPDGLQICKAFLRHKVYIVSPSVLRTHGVPFGTMVQYPGEFIITFPRGYHMGFNLGYNCAESTNFALERWIDYGKNAVLCYCRNDCVEIDMRPFMEKYRPDEYKEWLDYWYGEQPASYGAVKITGPKTRAATRRGSTSSPRQGSKSSSVETSKSDENLPVPCTKRLKAIFKARKLMDALWANKPVDLYAEKVHNSRSGRLYPHCAVCQHFVQRSVWMKGTPMEKLPEKSKRFVSDQMFEKRFRLDDLDLGRTKLEDDQLRECTNCRVVVHANCYPSHGGGVRTNDHAVPSTSSSSSSPASVGWLCERCDCTSDVLIRTASCSLCELRSGALMRNCTFRGESANASFGFVHVICALIDKSTRFLQQTDSHTTAQPKMSSSAWTTTVPQHHFTTTQGRHRSTSAELTNGTNGDSTAKQCSFSSHSPTLSTHPNLLPSKSEVPVSQNGGTLMDSGLADIYDLPTSNCSTFVGNSEDGSSSVITPKNAVGHEANIHHNQQPNQWPFLLNAANLQHKYSSASALQVLSCVDLCASSCAPTRAASPLPSSPSSISCAQNHHTLPAVEDCPAATNGTNANERSTVYQCEVCGHQSEHLIRCSICEEEKEAGAQLRFHVTCAPLADVTFERREFPGALAVCAFHHNAQFSVDSELADSRIFELKQRVIVDMNETEGDSDEKKDDRLIGYGFIYSISEHLYATVDFLDGTSSSEVFPSDITDCECKMLACNGGAHFPGALVYVRWEEDGGTYQAYYRGQSPRKRYKVKLYPPLSFEMKERKKAEEAVDDGGQTAKNKQREDEVEVTSDSIYRRDDLFPEYIRQALCKRKSGESNSYQHGRNS